MLSPHYQMTYYLLVAAALWTLYLVFFDPDRPADLTLAARAGPGVRRRAARARHRGDPGAAVPPVHPVLAPRRRRAEQRLGIRDLVLDAARRAHDDGPAAVQRRARRTTGAATSSSCTPSTSGAVVVVLAALGVGDRARRRLVLALGAIALLFLLVSFGGHTPFYYLWYEVMPMMKKVRAPGHGVLPGGAADGRVRRRSAWTGCSAARSSRRALDRRRSPCSAALALLGAARRARSGGDGARERRSRRLAWRPTRAALRGGVAPAARRGPRGRRRALGHLARTAPRRAWPRRRWRRWSSATSGASTGCSSPFAARPRRSSGTTPSRPSCAPSASRSGCSTSGVYQGSYLMAHDIQTMLGYHGQEVRFYDELLGGKDQWRNVGSPALLDLLGVRYLLLPDAQAVPGYHQVLGPVTTTPGLAGRPVRAGHGVPRTCGSCRARPSWPRTRPFRPSSTLASRTARSRSIRTRRRAHARADPGRAGAGAGADPADAGRRGPPARCASRSTAPPPSRPIS